jgi:hypothetical protein
MIAENPDLQFCDMGFAVSCRPITEAGQDWVAENLIADWTEGVSEEGPDLLWPVLIEHRYLEDIVLGARADGLVCHG